MNMPKKQNFIFYPRFKYFILFSKEKCFPYNLNEALSIAFQKYEKMKKHLHIILQAKVYLT